MYKSIYIKKNKITLHIHKYFFSIYIIGKHKEPRFLGTFQLKLLFLIKF